MGTIMEHAPTPMPARTRPPRIRPRPRSPLAPSMSPAPRMKMTEKIIRLFLRPRKYADTYANKLPKKAPAWYSETIVSLVVESSWALISLKPNSATKLGSDNVVPMKALRSVSVPAIAWSLAWRFWHCLPVVANHATGEGSHTSTCPDSPIVDGLGRWPILYDCEKTHVVDLVLR